MSDGAPVALFVFNRPEPTRRVFRRIAELKPSRLLLVADGPSPARPGEVELCEEVREIVGEVDWDCEVEQNFAASNLGCRARVSTGLDWVFERCERAIILEDDCLPDPSFFRFCDELLERYRDDERIMMISGNDHANRSGRSESSYRFSRYNFIWGWASWRRAWRHYDVSMAAWPRVRDSDLLRRVTGGRAYARYWREAFDRVYEGQLDTWDFQWMLTSWLRSGMAVVPNGNLVSNIGFGQDATHTVEENRLSNRPVSPMPFPLRHPARIEPDRRLDRFVADRVFEWAIPSRADEVRRAAWRALVELVPGFVRRGVKRRIREISPERGMP